MLATAAGSEVKLWDAEVGAAKLEVAGHTDLVHALSWKSDGTLLATTSKDQKLRIIDPRAASVVQETAAHTGNKASAVCWLGDHERVVTTGFTKVFSSGFQQHSDGLDLSNPTKPTARHANVSLPCGIAVRSTRRWLASPSTTPPVVLFVCLMLFDVCLFVCLFDVCLFVCLMSVCRCCLLLLMLFSHSQPAHQKTNQPARARMRTRQAFCCRCTMRTRACW